MSRKQTRHWSALVRLGFCLLVLSCGLQSPEYVDYQGEDSDAGGGATTDGSASSSGAGSEQSSTPGSGADACAAALKAFEGQVQPAIDSTCSSCHVSTTIGGKNLAKGAASKNRSVLLAYDATVNGSKLIAKYTSSGHGGGDQSKALPTSNIQMWKEAEAACSQ